MATQEKPREEFRALPLGYELRDSEDEMPTLVGHLAIFDEWAEIDSLREGHFLERMAPTAFNKTISENRDKMRVLFQHGQDTAIGLKPLGPISSLEADERGVRFEVPLLPTDYNRELLPGLRAGLFGTSFRFEALREHRERNPGKSQHNPRGLTERTVQEVRMREFGPVTFPAYAGAKVGLRSLTDEFSATRTDMETIPCLVKMYELGEAFFEDEDQIEDAADRVAMQSILDQLKSLIQAEANEPDEVEEPGEPELDDELASADKRAADAQDAPPNDGAGSSHPIRGRRAEAAPLYTGRKEEEPRWRL